MYILRNRPLKLATLTLLVLVITLITSLAFATETADADLGINPEEAIPLSSLSYQLIHVDGALLDMDDFWAGLLIGGIPENTPLPALVEIGLPEGTLTGWFGQLPSREIFDDAIQFLEPYQIRTEDGMDIYSAVLTHYHYVQLEFRYEGNPLSNDAEDIMSIHLSYAPIQDVEELMMTATFPAGFVATDEDLIFGGSGSNNEQAYTRVFENVSAGQTVSTTIDGFYAGEGAVESTTSTAAIIIIAAVAIALAAIIYFFLAKSGKSPE